MGSYVISDIHGCYDELIRMLENKLFKLLVQAQGIGCGVVCWKVLQRLG